MRFVILIAALILAKAINPELAGSDKFSEGVVCLGIALMIADVIDLFKSGK